MANNHVSRITHSVSSGTILKVIVILAALAFLWEIKSIVILLFVSVVIASALDPTIDYLQRYRIPRGVSVILIYIAVLSLVSFAVVNIAGQIAFEVREMARDIPQYYTEINTVLSRWFESAPQFVGERISTLRGGLDTFIMNMTQLASQKGLPVVTAIFGGIFSLILILVITFYFVVQENAVKHFITWLVPDKHADETVLIIDKIQKKLGLWLRGQLILSIVIFAITFVGLKILGVKYALVLATLAGILEIIPYLGPILSAVPAIFLTFSSGGLWQMLFVLILYFAVQQIENNFVVPKVMAKSVGLNPLIVIFAILIGGKIAGPIGALIAVPVVTGFYVFFQEKGYLKDKPSPTS